MVLQYHVNCEITRLTLWKREVSLVDIYAYLNASPTKTTDITTISMRKWEEYRETDENMWVRKMKGKEFSPWDFLLFLFPSFPVKLQSNSDGGSSNNGNCNNKSHAAIIISRAILVIIIILIMCVHFMPHRYSSRQKNQQRTFEVFCCCRGDMAGAFLFHSGVYLVYCLLLRQSVNVTFLCRFLYFVFMLKFGPPKLGKWNNWQRWTSTLQMPVVLAPTTFVSPAGIFEENTLYNIFLCAVRNLLPSEQVNLGTHTLKHAIIKIHLYKVI